MIAVPGDCAAAAMAKTAMGAATRTRSAGFIAFMLTPIKHKMFLVFKSRAVSDNHWKTALAESSDSVFALRLLFAGLGTDWWLVRQHSG